jgi:hypothetical protein
MPMRTFTFFQLGRDLDGIDPGFGLKVDRDILRASLKRWSHRGRPTFYVRNCNSWRKSTTAILTTGVNIDLFNSSKMAPTKSLQIGVIIKISALIVLGYFASETGQQPG